MLFRSLALRAAGRLQEALDLLSEPGSFSRDVHTLRGDLQMDLGQFHEAVGSYSTVVAFEDHNMYAYHHLAVCLGRLERWEPAAEAFRKLLAHDTYNDQAHIGLGDCLLHLNRPEEALKCFETCWSEAARLPAMFGKAVALQLLRRFDEAEALYQRVLMLQPGFEEALGNLIAMSMEVFDLTRVKRYAQQLLALAPESPLALQALTVVACERREYAIAAALFGAWLEHPAASPRHPPGAAPDGLEYRLSAENVARLRSLHEPGGEA